MQTFETEPGNPFRDYRHLVPWLKLDSDAELTISLASQATLLKMMEAMEQRLTAENCVPGAEPQRANSREILARMRKQCTHEDGKGVTLLLKTRGLAAGMKECMGCGHRLYVRQVRIKFPETP